MASLVSSSSSSSERIPSAREDRLSRSTSTRAAAKKEKPLSTSTSTVATPDRNWKKILKHGFIATIDTAALAILATAAVGLLVTAGFMFSIGVGMPDGIYLLGTAILCAGLAAVAAKKLYKYSRKTHEYLNPSPAPAA